MSSYYLSEDLARFGEIGKATPQLFEQFLNWYKATMEPGVRRSTFLRRSRSYHRRRVTTSPGPSR